MYIISMLKLCSDSVVAHSFWAPNAGPAAIRNHFSEGLSLPKNMGETWRVSHISERKRGELLKKI